MTPEPGGRGNGEGRIFVFYSFKGGVGRTLALANVGHLLAAYGRNVLLIDADLEAPGLSSFLMKRRRAKAGFVEFFLELRSIFSRKGSQATVSNLSGYMTRLAVPKNLATSPFARAGRLALMPAGGNDGAPYVDKLEDLRVAEAYRRGLGRAFFETLGACLRGSGFDYVLIDARTGYSDLTGALVNDASDHVVVISGLNQQNVAGTLDYLRLTGLLDSEKWGRATLVVSPVPREETELRRQRVRAFQQVLGRGPDAVLTYHPRLALIEELFVSAEPGDQLAGEYRALTKRLLELADDEAEQHIERAAAAASEGKLDGAVDETAAAATQRPDLAVAFLRALSNALNQATATGEPPTDLLLARAFAAGIIAAVEPSESIAFYNWGNDLGNLATRLWVAGDQAAARDRFEQAFEQYARAVAIKPDLHEAFYNWGATLFGLARRLRASASGAEADEAALQGAEVFVRALDAAGGQAVIPYTAALPLLESSIRSANPEMARRALRLAARAAEVAPAPADFFTLAVAHALAGEADQSRRLLADLARRDERSEWLDPLLADPLVGEDLKRYAAELAASVPQKKHRAASKRPSKR